jgi:hypothetical protein
MKFPQVPILPPTSIDDLEKVLFLVFRFATPKVKNAPSFFKVYRRCCRKSAESRAEFG